MDPELRSITDRIHAALARRTPLRLRGGGTKDFYGQSLQGEVLELSAWRGIISYEPSELVVTVRAGTPVAELEATLAERGQHLAFDPPQFAVGATCGGAVAAGLSGPARANAGAVRDFVLGLTLINGRGESLSFGGQVIKNVAGYDVSRLMVGAMGTLGVLTEISLKVLPAPRAEATLTCRGLTQDKALNLLHRWGGQPLPLNASCWTADTDASAPGGRLWVRLRGAVAAVQTACRPMLAELQAEGGVAMRLDDAPAQDHWRACRDQTLPFFHAPAADLGLWRLSLPQTAPALTLPWAQLVEWHGGQRWLWAPAQAHAQLREAARAVGGAATLFIAPRSDIADGVARFSPLEPALARIHQRLKAEFDPAGIFNPGRMYADL